MNQSTSHDDDFVAPTAHGATDIGKKRAVNQDQFLIAELNKSMLVSSTSLSLTGQFRLFGRVQGQVLLVADGMGGHAAGEKASSLAIDHLVTRLLNSVHWFFQSDSEDETAFLDSMKKLFQDAHARILAESAEHVDERGMGTTLTMAYIMWPRMYVIHAGDSRCYLVRDGIAQQETTDHTLARKMVEAGGMKPEDESTSRWSNVLWNVLGGTSEAELSAEVRRVDLVEGDVVLLCSDGLYRYLDGAAIAEQVGKQNALPELCKTLIQMANDAGGEDNITVVVAKPEPNHLASHERVAQCPDEVSTIVTSNSSIALDDTLPDDTLPGE
ncbi:PP2C family protein-serine/threonine phosphatase [Stieleria varia]|uniref:PP2C family protein-serine/threonine phosphatase n=1 Tax=Stieleria varia TaxID=2528005 RepID=UPI001E655E74|nr:protein phosphatase 2C domain-containing protein [Stieleria varia]